MRSLIYWSLALLTAVNVHAHKVSNTGRCGKSNNGLVCTGSAFGNCCSQSGWCGTSPSHCGVGCDKNFGTCTPATSSYSPTAKISYDGTCGGSKGFTCQGSSFGNCCSSYGYCGSTSAYCGTGCNSKFGSCARVQTTSSTRPASTKASSSSSAARPASTGKVSTNARCGYMYGATEGFSCQGSKFGDCCSEYSYCGSDPAYCGAKCQPGFGRCTSPQSSSSLICDFVSSTDLFVPIAVAVAVVNHTNPRYTFNDTHCFELLQQFQRFVIKRL
ncbi:Keratin-associated protein 5-4 [Pyrenophora tritici-repentis]|nr:Keratin-associated protein 5-4 [Pyrenophora tritici-repentis]KAI0572193.1 Keratin-associated protein 5-4 [Pyrenophora tritici-repentis]